MNEFKVIGSLESKFESTNRIYDVEGCSPTLSTMQGGGQEPKILVNSFDKPKCINSKGGRNGIDNLQPSIQDRCYSENGISFTITSSFLPSVLTESQIVAMRGRNPDNPSDRSAGSPTKQRLEVNTQRTSNCLTSVKKDNLVMEEAILQRARGFNAGGEHKICPPITANSFQNNNLLKCKYRIRKLTPRECGRLMGVSDEDISKMAAVNSNTQLYKQFGNSIVVDVMCAMFKNLNIKQGE